MQRKESTAKRIDYLKSKLRGSMATAIGRAMGTALMSSRVPCRYLSSPVGKCASTVLVDDALADVPLSNVEVPPFLLQRRVILYDGVCHLCHGGVKWIIKADKDRKIKFCCVQSKAAEPYMKVCGVTREDVLRRFLFVEGPDSYHQGSDAALRVLSYLPLPYSALSSLMIVPSPLRDSVYDYVAKRRYNWFGKGDDCLVLKEVELLERFVDWEELLERSRSQQL